MKSVHCDGVSWKTEVTEVQSNGHRCTEKISYHWRSGGDSSLFLDLMEKCITGAFFGITCQLNHWRSGGNPSLFLDFRHRGIFGRNMGEKSVSPIHYYKAELYSRDAFCGGRTNATKLNVNVESSEHSRPNGMLVTLSTSRYFKLMRWVQKWNQTLSPGCLAVRVRNQHSLCVIAIQCNKVGEEQSHLDNKWFFYQLWKKYMQLSIHYYKAELYSRDAFCGGRTSAVKLYHKTESREHGRPNGMLILVRPN